MRPRWQLRKARKALLLLKIRFVETKAKAAIHLRVINGGLQYTAARCRHFGNGWLCAQLAALYTIPFYD